MSALNPTAAPGKPGLARAVLVAALLATALLISTTTGIPGAARLGHLFGRSTAAGFGLVVASQAGGLSCSLGGAVPAGLATCAPGADLTAASGSTTLSFRNSGSVDAHVAVTVGACHDRATHGVSACAAGALSVAQALSGQPARTLVAPTALGHLAALGPISFLAIPPGATLSVWWRHTTLAGPAPAVGADQQVAWQFAQ